MVMGEVSPDDWSQKFRGLIKLCWFPGAVTTQMEGLKQNCLTVLRIRSQKSRLTEP